jgi:hypothetical protein
VTSYIDKEVTFVACLSVYVTIALITIVTWCQNLEVRGLQTKQRIYDRLSVPNRWEGTNQLLVIVKVDFVRELQHIEIIDSVLLDGA